jgi:hypothetical protein
MDIIDLRAEEWKKKINEGDPLHKYKAEAIIAAAELYYPDYVMESILVAKTERETDRALTTHRIRNASNAS